MNNACRRLTDSTPSENDRAASKPSGDKTSPFQSPPLGVLKAAGSSRQLRRRSPLSPLQNDNRRSTQETPRMREEKNTAEENVARRKSVSFSPQPHQTLSYFTIQAKLMIDDGDDHHDGRTEGAPSADSNEVETNDIATDESDLEGSLDVDQYDSYQPPSDLHEFCHKAASSLDLIQAKSVFLQSSDSRELISAARRKDALGRLPLHILSENTALSMAIFSRNNDQSFQSAFDLSDEDREALAFVTDVLSPANASALTCRDNDGYFPFERAIVDWIHSAHSSSTLPRRSSRRSSFSRSSFLMKPSLGSAAVTTEKIQKSVSSAINWAGRSLYLNRSLGSVDSASDVESAMAGGTIQDLSDDDQSDRAFDKSDAGGNRIGYRVFPLNVKLTPHMRFALVTLSISLDLLNEAQSQRSFRGEAIDHRCRIIGTDGIDSFQTPLSAMGNTIAEGLAAIPDIIKAVLLLKDDSERKWACSCTLIRRVMSKKQSIGPWLVHMLQHPNKAVSERAVDYLRLVSDVFGENNAFKSNDRSSQDREGLYNEISKLDGLIPSLLSLEVKAIEEAATTPVIKDVLDKMIARPFVVTVVFFDALFLLVLILSFRLAVVGFLTGEAPGTVLKWIYVANAGIFYFIIRELGKAISLCMITARARTYFLSFWNVSDVLAIVLALVSTIAMRVNFTHDDLNLNDLTDLRGFLAVTTGLLWLRVLSLLKTINMQLATFVLAIVQITRDILWFLLILLTLVVASAQMFYTILIPASCASDKIADEARQCSPSEYYLAMYTVLLGDFGLFDREHFTTAFSVLLMVAYSFQLVIIILNVLIAIVSDSYEKCLIKSHSLFGRARVMLLAELVSFQNLLRVNTDPNHQAMEDVQIPIYNRWCSKHVPSKRLTRSSALFFSLSAAVLLAWMIGETAGHFAGERYGNYLFSFCSILINTFLFAGIVVFLSRSTPGDASGSSDDASKSGNRFFRLICTWYEQFIQRRMRRILGSTRHATSPWSVSGRAGDADEWRGRVNHLQREMSRIAQESSVNVAERTRAIEQHVTCSETRIRGEMNTIEGQMESLKSDIMSELRGSERRTEELIRSRIDELMRILTDSCSV